MVVPKMLSNTQQHVCIWRAAGKKTFFKLNMGVSKIHFPIIWIVNQHVWLSQCSWSLWLHNLTPHNKINLVHGTLLLGFSSTEVHNRTCMFQQNSKILLLLSISYTNIKGKNFSWQSCIFTVIWAGFLRQVLCKTRFL